MSHDNELAMVRNLEAAHERAKATNSPADWRKYYRLRAVVDRKLKIIANQAIPAKRETAA